MDGSKIKKFFPIGRNKEELKTSDKEKAEEIVESLTKKVEEKEAENSKEDKPILCQMLIKQKNRLRNIKTKNNCRQFGQRSRYYFLLPVILEYGGWELQCLHV